MGYQITLIAGRPRRGIRQHISETPGGRLLVSADVFPLRFRNGGLSPMDIAGRMRHVARVRYDLVHAFEPRPATVWPALLARRRWGVPYVAECDDLWGGEGIAATRPLLERATLGRMDEAVEQYVWTHADAIVSPSTDVLRRARAAGMSEDRMQLVQVGADFEQIVPLPQGAMRQRYGVPTEAHVVVHAGSTRYDADLLAESFVALARLDSKAFLLMVGGRLPSVERRLEEAGLHSRWGHAGFLPISRLGEVLSCGDVALMPYSDRPLNRGRFPSRFGDYLAAGCPIVTNPTGDAGRIVREERVGVVAPEDPEGFAAAVMTLLTNGAAVADMRRRARRLAETRFSWRAMAEPLDDLFRRLLCRDGRGRPEMPRHA
jgi:glycosyltransferase involved in cell wall biosynthesis